jgi:hypothetical protein
MTHPRRPIRISDRTPTIHLPGNERAGESALRRSASVSGPTFYRPPKSFEVGDTVVEQAPSDASYVSVFFPEGDLMAVVPLVSSAISIQLPRAGTWRYEWSTGAGGEWVVRDRAVDPAPVVPGEPQKVSVATPSYPLSSGPA